MAFDAATRGYSVALVEKADFASGTSSRSSKLVHGGLRYLQNFDLGLVREALLERQLMVALAPHLVRPLPLVVPAFDGARPDRLIGVGLNLYDVMAVDKLRRAGAARTRDGDDVDPRLEPRAPPDHLRRGGRRAAAGARRRASPTSGYLFYDCQTDDARLVLTVLAEAERFGAVCANALEVTELVEEDGRAAACACATRDRRASSSCAPTTSSTRPASGPTGCARASCTTRPRCRASGRAAGRTSRCRHETLPLVDGAIVPAGGGRSIFALPWLGSTLIGTTDNDYDSERPRPHPAGRRRHRVPARRDQRVLRHVADRVATSPAPTPACGR